MQQSSPESYHSTNLLGELVASALHSVLFFLIAHTFWRFNVSINFFSTSIISLSILCALKEKGKVIHLQVRCDPEGG